MKTFEQKRQELQTEKQKISGEFELLRLRLEDIEAKLNLLNDAELLLSDEEIVSAGGTEDETKKEKLNASPFSVVGSMPIRDAIIKALSESNQPMDMDGLMPRLQSLGIISNKKSVRSRLAKMVDKDVERVAEGIYRIMRKN